MDGACAVTLSVFAAAREAPGAPALVVNGHVITFGALAERVLRVAGEIRARARSSDLVALSAGADLETLERLHALFALGVPALVMHPRLTALERRELVERCSPALVLDGAVRDGALARDVAGVPDDERPLAIVHTSGSSGRPKGVVLSRRAFAASARASAENLGWRADDRWLLALPTAHVGGLSIVTRCLLARRPVVLAPPAPSFNARALARVVEAERVTLLSLVPAQLAQLLALEPAWRPPARLRAVLLGGAPATPSLLARAAERGMPVLTTYGLTEACSQVTTERPGAPPPADHAARGAGLALPGVEVRVADGAIEVRGATLLSGYHPPQDDAPVFADGWFRTGDLGTIDATGRLHVIGRSSDVIVTGGENVHPAEIERALESCPGVLRACVFGVEDAVFGERVAAALVARGARPSLRDLAVAVEERLAPFKRPRLIAWLDELPLTATGKVDRKEAARVAMPFLEG
jgi:o-succinylbenzoate---CoA ligase